MSTAQQVEHQGDRQRFVVAHGGRESELTYSHQGENALALEHTFVPPEHRGQGIAEQLTRAALAYAAANDLKIIPACSYVQRFVEKHVEFSSLVVTE